MTEHDNYNNEIIIIRATYVFRLWDWKFRLYGADSRWHEWRLARRSRGQDTMQGAASPLTHRGLDLFLYTRPRIYHCTEGSTWCPTHVQRQHATWNSKLRTPRWNFTASGIRLGGGKRDSQASVCACVSWRKADCLTWWIVREKFTRLVSAVSRQAITFRDRM